MKPLQKPTGEVDSQTPCQSTKLALPNPPAVGAVDIDPEMVELVYDHVAMVMYLSLRPQLKTTDSRLLDDEFCELLEEYAPGVGVVDFSEDGQIVGIEFFVTQETSYLYGVMDRLGLVEHYQQVMRQWHDLEIPSDDFGSSSLHHYSNYVKVDLLAGSGIDLANSDIEVDAPSIH